jgi:Domain of unknown function (DUF5658)
MSRRLLVTTAIVIWSLAGPSLRSANAQERASDVAITPVLSAEVVATAVAKATDPATDPQRPVDLVFATPKKSFGMVPFYVTSAVLQAMDVHSTLRVLELGGREGNPMLAGLVNNRPAFIAVKGAVAAGTIYAVSRIAKHNKIAAMAMSMALNSTYAMVVSHNYKLARSMR